MKFASEYRDPELGKRLIDRIRRHSTRPIRLVEFCSGHTVGKFSAGQGRSESNVMHTSSAAQ